MLYWGAMKTWMSVCLVGVVFAGCTSAADDLTLDGADDLKNCDIRAAHDKFADAHADDPDHPQAALGFALTSLALLPEDPEVTQVLSRIGFTSAIDMQALVFGPDGALARHARGDTCDSINTFIDTTVPYPPLATATIDGTTLIDQSLTGTDIAVAAQALSPQLAEIAAALETAAAGMSGPIEVEGGCGVGKVTFQAPELYAMAALIEGARSIAQLGQAYDWNLSIRQLSALWDGDAFMLATFLNAHLGRVTAPGEGAAARPIVARALALMVRAIDAAKVATVEPYGLFDWTAFPASLLDNARLVAVAGQAMLDGSTAIPTMTPDLALDLSSVFATPIDLQSFSQPLVEALDEFSWSWSSATLEQALTPLFAPNPFVDTVTFTWTFDQQWTAFDATPVTTPFDRYDAVYQCMATPL